MLQRGWGGRVQGGSKEVLYSAWRAPLPRRLTWPRRVARVGGKNARRIPVVACRGGEERGG